VIRHLIYAGVALFLIGCASAPVPTGKLPPITDPVTAGEIVVIRVSSVTASAVTYYINVNQEDVFGIRSGEHTRLRLAAGDYRIALRCFGGSTPSWKETVTNQTVRSGQTIYIAVSPKFELFERDCLAADVVPELEGKKLIAATTFRPIQ
jgi:hypothetical protein